MANKRRQLYKKKSFVSKVDVKEQVYKQTLKQVQETNARLDSLSRRYKQNTWASKKLINRLDSETVGAVSGKGRIKISKKMTSTQLKAVQKATKQFLESQTSTKAGIKNVRKSVKAGIKQLLSNDEIKKEISDEDADIYYEMLSENDFQYFADKIKASTMWTLIDDAKEEEISKDSFLKRLSGHIDFSNDLDVKEKAMRLYDKYVL